MIAGAAMASQLGVRGTNSLRLRRLRLTRPAAGPPAGPAPCPLMLRPLALRPCPALRFYPRLGVGVPDRLAPVARRLGFADTRAAPYRRH